MANFKDVFVDKDKYLEDVYKVGSFISYSSMLMNIVVFAIFCRKTLLSPATILMQGLAASDFLTAFSSYGLQPLFHSKFNCTFRSDISLYACDLHYPYSSMITHISILFFTFHNVSYLITTCLGIQKVIAIIFQIWTRNQLNKKKAVISCVVCFILPIILSIPRHLSIWFENFFNFRLNSNNKFLYRKYEGIIEYSAAYYLMIQTDLITCCCVVLLMSTLFIVYKLVTNRFQGRMTEQRRQEKRAIIMIFIVLAIFLLTEVPRVLLYVWWSYNYINGIKDFHDDSNYNMYWSLYLIKSFKEEMDILLKLVMPTVLYITRRIIIECIDVFTVVGCLSNFIIYIVMSTKMRNEIKKIFSQCQYLIGRNPIQKETVTGKPPKNEIEINPMQRTEQENAVQMTRRISRLIKGTGYRQNNDCQNERQRKKIQEIRNCKTNEKEMSQIDVTEHNRTHMIEMNPIQETGDRCTNETVIISEKGTGHSHRNEIDMDKW